MNVRIKTMIVQHFEPAAPNRAFVHIVNYRRCNTEFVIQTLYLQNVHNGQAY